MIVALLILIFLILLFGAGVVKGWLANLAGAIVAGILVVAGFLTVSALVGPDNMWKVVTGVGAVFLALAIGGKVWIAYEDEKLERLRVEQKRQLEQDVQRILNQPRPEPYRYSFADETRKREELIARARERRARRGKKHQR